MFYELLNILNFDFFTYNEGFGRNKRKIRRAKKKAKKSSNEANQFANSISSSVASTANEIQAKMNESSYSACNRDLIPNKEDLSILLDKLEETEKNIKNDDNTLKSNESYDTYNYWINFNNDYEKNLLDYEKDLFNYAYGEEYYDEILKKRDKYVNIDNSSNLFNKDFNNLDKNLQKTIFINKEINSNQIILEKNIESLTDQKEKLYNKINNTSNNIYVDNRDSYYDNNLYSYYLFLIQIILYFYSFFYIILFFQEINKDSFSYFYSTIKLIIIALLPNLIFDNLVFIIYKMINFF